MARFHATSEGNIPFTVDEEAEWDAQELANLHQVSKDLIKQQIAQLENLITPRRTRESILGTDNGWLADIELKIQELRGQL